jgi:hypothetical protein
LRLHTPREPRHGSSRWSVIRYALGSNGRTARFCIIWVVMTGGPVTAVVTELILHIRLQAHVLGPAMRAARGRERHQVLIRSHGGPLGRAEHGLAHQVLVRARGLVLGPAGALFVPGGLPLFRALTLHLLPSHGHHGRTDHRHFQPGAGTAGPRTGPAQLTARPRRWPWPRRGGYFILAIRGVGKTAVIRYTRLR